MKSIILLAILLGSVYGNSWPQDRANERNKLAKKVVCYWGTWAFYRPGAGSFAAENVNPHLCTHLMYGFAKLEGNSIALYDPDLDAGSEDWNSGLPWGRGMIRRMNALRTINPNLATIIAIGGWNEGSDKYSAMASTAAGRATFVSSVLAFLAEHKLDGLDLDWEYPAMSAVGDGDRLPTGPEIDKQNFLSLVQELKAAFAPYGYILSSAVSAGKPTIDRAYDIVQLSQSLDFLNLMTYDFHGGWDNVTGHNAPLYPMPGATGIDLEFTVEYAVNYWIQNGVDPAKLNMGMPVYGRTFTLANAHQNGLGAPAIGTGGNAGPITRVIGTLGYNEICSLLQQGYQYNWNEIQQIPYATYTNQWIGYDDVTSLGKKLDFLLSKGLGGGMVWSIDTDDFGGGCGNGKFPLLKTISRALIGVDGPDTFLAPPAIAHRRPEKRKPTVGAARFRCAGVGLFKDPLNRSRYYLCENIGFAFKARSFGCARGTRFDEKVHTCH